MNVFDAHCDTISKSFRDQRSLLRENPDGHWDMKRMRSFSHCAQFFAIFHDAKGCTQRELHEIFQAQYDFFCQEINRYSDAISFCRTVEHAKSAFENDKVAAFLSVEGADLLGCSLEGLERAYHLGVRAVNLTWNRANALSGSAVEESHRGLSDLGQCFVQRMQELGMLVDVSHLSEPGFWDVIALAQRPIMASHSNSQSVCKHPRNLTDDQFTALIKNNGVAGLNCYADFLGENSNLDSILRHLEHFWALGGENHLCLGCDWDGCDKLPQGMEDGLGGLTRLYEYLLQKNVDNLIIDKLYYKNLARVVKQVCIM